MDASALEALYKKHLAESHAAGLAEVYSAGVAAGALTIADSETLAEAEAQVVSEPVVESVVTESVDPALQPSEAAQ